MATIDTLWFIHQINMKYKSIRQFAFLMEKNGKQIDRAQVWRMIHGQRAITVGEAKQIAKLLRVPLIEVIKRIE